MFGGPLVAAIHGASMQAPSQKFRAQLAKAKKGNTEAQAFVETCYSFSQEGVTKEAGIHVLSHGSRGWSHRANITLPHITPQAKGLSLTRGRRRLSI